MSSNLYADPADKCFVDRGAEKIPLYGKCCIKKEDYYIVVTHNDNLCQAKANKVEEKGNNPCQNPELGAQILFESLERYHKRNIARNQKKRDSSEKTLGFHARGFFVTKESEISKDKVADYAKNGVQNILYFQENKISAYKTGKEIEVNLKDVLPKCK